MFCVAHYIPKIQSKVGSNPTYTEDSMPDFNSDFLTLQINTRSAPYKTQIILSLITSRSLSTILPQQNQVNRQPIRTNYSSSTITIINITTMGRTFIWWCSLAALILPATQVLAAAAAGPEGAMGPQLMRRQTTSDDGVCGQSSGKSCTNSGFGNCCSEFGFWYVTYFRVISHYKLSTF